MHAELTRIREIDATLQKLESICVPMAHRAQESELVSLLNLFSKLRSERHALARQVSLLTQTPTPTLRDRKKARARAKMQENIEQLADELQDVAPDVYDFLHRMTELSI